MNTRFRNRLGAAFIAAVSITVSHAAGMGGGPGGMGGQQGMMGDPARMQRMMEQRTQMMEQRNQMMKSMLELTPGQEAAFNKFAGRQQGVMKKMMERRQKMMQSGDGRQGMMSHMAGMGFEQNMRMMQENAEQMLSISEAGLEFYKSLTPEQQKKLNDMPEQMQNMHRPQSGGLQQDKP